MKSEVESESKDMGIVLDSIVQEYRERYKIKDKILRHKTTAAGISSTSMRSQKQPATDGWRPAQIGLAIKIKTKPKMPESCRHECMFEMYLVQLIRWENLLEVRLVNRTFRDVD